MKTKTSVTHISGDFDSGSRQYNYIKDYRFNANNDLEEIIIDDNVEEIGAEAFSSCPNLKKVTLPKNLKRIGRDAFSECTSLKEIIIPDSVEVIGNRAFADCTRLKKAVLPKNQVYLEQSIFAGCKKLVDVSFPEDIEVIPAAFFLGCESLDIIIPKIVYKVSYRAFEGCKNLTHFPSHVQIFESDCYANCSSLDHVNIENAKVLPEGMFCNCRSLSDINSKHKLNIGKCTFKGCVSLKEVPSFIKDYAEFCFENCEGLTEVDLISSYIPAGCFKGCTNLSKVNNQEKIKIINPYGFSGCTSLETLNLSGLEDIASVAFEGCTGLKEINLGENIPMISNGLFTDCTSLEKISIPNTVTSIGNKAFYNCKSLKNIKFPNSLTGFGREVFVNCENITSISIPSNVQNIQYKTFIGMPSLKRVEVSKYNKHYYSPDNKIIVDNLGQNILLYAPALEDESYSILDFVLTKTEDGEDLICPINGIRPYAFSGAKNLKELHIASCVDEVDYSSFKGCDNLKKLIITGVPLYSSFSFRVQQPLMVGENAFVEDFRPPKDGYMPFEELIIDGNAKWITCNAFNELKRLKSLKLNTDQLNIIHGEAFTGCPKLKEVKIPDSVSQIARKAFRRSTELKFSNGIVADGHLKLESSTYVDTYKLYESGGIYIIQDGDTLIEYDDIEMQKLISNYEWVANNRVLVYDYIKDLKRNGIYKEGLLDGILMLMSLENRKILFDNKDLIDDFFFEVLDNSRLLVSGAYISLTGQIINGKDFQKFIDYVRLFKKHNIIEPELQNKLFIALMNPDMYERIINYDKDLFLKIVRDSKLRMIPLSELPSNENPSKTDVNKNLQDRVNNLEDFVKVMKKYEIKDSYLFQEVFIGIVHEPLFTELLGAYDANIKRLLKESKTVLVKNTNSQNLLDLLKFMKMLGCFSKDPITKQKASTFITEKIFSPTIPVKKTKTNPDGEIDNDFRIVGDDIHSVFNLQSASKYKPDFSTFFMENYKALISHEKSSQSGFIERIYNNFDRIQETCTSNRGDQRKLKVSLQKCINYLTEMKFRHTTPETKELAKVIGEWFDRDSTFDNALRVYEESLNAPRNIFVKHVTDEKTGNVIYDNRPECDLKEDVNINDYSYEWLPKQDYRNLVLGKYCGCCAHIEGAGQGIMRASMILDCCQNLTIKNTYGTIVAKATLYVNRRKGYAVFNNVESSLGYRDDGSLETIYRAFMRGTKAFIDEYNKNNGIKISHVTIGASRNTINSYLTDENGHPETDIQTALTFGNYSLSGSGYTGDWTVRQRRVYPSFRP